MTRQTSKPANVNLPAWNSDAFSSRLKDALGSRTPYFIEKQTGIAQSLVRKYLRGDSIPGTDKLVALAAVTGVSVAWLATGQEEKAPKEEDGSGVNFDALEQVVTKTRRMLSDKNVNLSPEAEGRVVRLIYEFYTKQGQPMDEASLDNVIELAAFR